MEQDKKSGFTLLETLIAFVILTLTIGTLLPILAHITKRQSMNQLAYIAHEIGLSAMAELRVLSPEDVARSYQTYQPWRVEITLEPSGLPTSSPVYRADVITFRANNELSSVSAWIFDP